MRIAEFQRKEKETIRFWNAEFRLRIYKKRKGKRVTLEIRNKKHREQIIAENLELENSVKKLWGGEQLEIFSFTAFPFLVY